MGLARAFFLGLALAASVAVTAPTMAQTAFSGDGKPMEISADKGIEWNREEHTYIARGNATATKDGTEIRADELRAYYSAGSEGTGDIYKVEAIGGVVVTSADGKVYGDRGTYDVKTQVMVMTGSNLRLVTDKNVVTAKKSLEYWQAKNQAVARGNAEVTSIDKEKGTKNIVRADVMTANFAKDAKGTQEMQLVDAYDSVEILTPCEYITADQGQYRVPEQIATLTGNVKITRGNNQLNGDAAEVNMATGISTLKGDRVQGLLIPQTSEKGSEPAAAGQCD